MEGLELLLRVFRHQQICAGNLSWTEWRREALDFGCDGVSGFVIVQRSWSDLGGWIGTHPWHALTVVGHAPARPGDLQRKHDLRPYAEITRTNCVMTNSEVVTDAT